MPLQHLIDTFNSRFVTDYQLDSPPFRFDGERVHGCFGNLSFTSDLKPIRLYANPDLIIGHDTAPLILKRDGAHDTTRLLYGEEKSKIVSLDRLSRTVHMLNYLILDQHDGRLFVSVHPHHILTIKRDHGAYFEDIIRRCGLPLRRVVIELTISTLYESQLLLLLERLRTYRERGYSTSVKIDEHAGSDFAERFRSQFLHRLPPDYIRFSASFLDRAYPASIDKKRRSSLLSAIRQVDTQVLVASIKTEADGKLMELVFPDYVQGVWYDKRLEAAPPLLKAV